MSTVLDYNIIASGLPAPFRIINTMTNDAGYVIADYDTMHLHDFYHVNYITDGKMTIRFEETEYEVLAGQAFILPPRIPHSLFSDEGYAQVGIDVLEQDDQKGIYRMIKEASDNCCRVTKPFSVPTSYKELTALLQNPTQIHKLLAHNIAENIVLRALNNLYKSQ